MIGLLKTFAKGLLYVIGLPFFLVALALFGAVGLIAFVFQIIKSIIFFFTGQKFFPELPEDKELRLLKEGSKPTNETSEPINNNQTNNVFDSFVASSTTIEHHEPVNEAPAPIIEEAKPTPAPSIEETCFNEPKEELQEEPVIEEKEDVNPFDSLLNNQEEPVQEEIAPMNEEPIQEIQEETVLETNTTQEKEDDELMEELETYVPRSSNYSAADDEEDNDTDSGVNIDYNL